MKRKRKNLRKALLAAFRESERPEFTVARLAELLDEEAIAVQRVLSKFAGADFEYEIRGADVVWKLARTAGQYKRPITSIQIRGACVPCESVTRTGTDLHLRELDVATGVTVCGLRVLVDERERPSDVRISIEQYMQPASDWPRCPTCLDAIRRYTGTRELKRHQSRMRRARERNTQPVM